MIAALSAALFLVAGPEIGQLRDGVVHVTAEEAAELLEANPEVTVLDVRTRSEYDDGHIEGAVQVNYFSPNFRAQVAELDLSGGVLVHCKSGRRSSRALRILKDLEVETIYHLDGGILAWRKAGLATVRGNEEATE
ncbi:rhodanese-like domain-containing protein [Parvularcula lutaonensis]|uniref:Rhodanese-like domain-containing protein n=1 Tax=Parvularcula lutaonensis TaxID=491923 RepID=A0ABV7MEJ1_9PROT|nr:rhodanese-like domain-containing protein [Parvularcula lutaonensis]GGY52003.1 hypothetical protein GCM10007148_21250 [Parvularcula lutaonensis]